MERVSQVLNLDEAVCISHSANTLGKGMNPTILSGCVSISIKDRWSCCKGYHYRKWRE